MYNIGGFYSCQLTVCGKEQNKGEWNMFSGLKNNYPKKIDAFSMIANKVNLLDKSLPVLIYFLKSFDENL